MKITAIRYEGKKLKLYETEQLAQALELAFAVKGYETNVTALNATTINISQNSRCFSINTKMHGYNAIINTFNNYKKGYKRTNVPIWSQRVDFNNTLNEILNKYEVSANVKAGPFTIRQGTKVMTEADWYAQLPAYTQGYNSDYGVNGLGMVLTRRMTEAQAKEQV